MSSQTLLRVAAITSSSKICSWVNQTSKCYEYGWRN